MRGKKHLQVLAFLSVISLICVSASPGDPPANINDIKVQSGPLSTRIVLESTSPVEITSSRYIQATSPTLAIDLDKAVADQTSNITFDKVSVVKDIKLEKGEGNSFRLLFDLKEKVPYRIYTDARGAVIEFNQFQNGSKEYLMDPVLREKVESQLTDLAYLKNIKVNTQADRVDVTAELTDNTLSHVFVLNDPLRLVVDLHNTMLTQKAKTYSVNSLGVDKVRAAQFQIGDPYTITRMVFDLSEPQLYTLNPKNDSLTVSFYKKAEPASEPPAPAIEALETQTHPQPPQEEKPAEETKIETQVLLSDMPKANEPPVAIPTKEAPKVETEKPEKTPANANIGVPAIEKPKQEVEAASQQENQFVPRTIRQKEQKYTGEIISFKFHDADLQAVIFYIAEFAGLNVTFDPGVTGIVSVNLVDVPWDQALDLILKQNKMGRVIEGNVLRIAPIGVLTREQEDQRKLAESKEMAGPLVTRTYWLSYSRAEDVQQLLGSKLSSRGEIIVDSRTNTMTITDVEDRLGLIETMIEVYDTPTPQVSIEARVVEATSTFIRNLGIQWGFRAIQDPFYGNQGSLKFPARSMLDGALIPEGIVTKGISGPLGGYAINLPAPAFSTAVGLSMANILDTFRLDMALTALETSGSGRIISSPKVTTQNNQEAEIIQGRQIPVQTVANFTVTTRYVNAALELRATPQITAEGTIIMRIDIQNNAADFANLVNGIPPITRQSANTTVMVPDGGTTVIGGIYRSEDSITRERVPLLHKIPILGNLFKSFARTKQNRELLIFITPRIIK